MGQIIFNGQKPKYCNLVAITTGSHAADVLATGEVWLIDSTNASKTDGTGKYDKYIVGDNIHTANQLASNPDTLFSIDNAQQIDIDLNPTSGSSNAVSSGGVYQAIQNIDVSDQINGKADKSEMSVVAGTGANADKTTITLKNGTSATVLTQHQDISGKANLSDLATVARTGSYNDLFDTPTIHSDVTESTVSDWGFTKNAGTITGITMNNVSKGTDGIVNLGTVITDVSDKADAADVYTIEQVDDIVENVVYFGNDDESTTTVDFDSQSDTVWNKAQVLSAAQQEQARTNIGAGTVSSITINGTTYNPTNGNVDLGTTASITIGTTTTGAAGSSASVTNTGTVTEPVLNFTIPQGAQGVKGDTVIMGNEATYTLYSLTGDADDGAMTQQAVTRELTELGTELEGLDLNLEKVTTYYTDNLLDYDSLYTGYKNDATAPSATGSGVNAYYNGRIDVSSYPVGTTFYLYSKTLETRRAYNLIAGDVDGNEVSADSNRSHGNFRNWTKTSENTVYYNVSLYQGEGKTGVFAGIPTVWHDYNAVKTRYAKKGSDYIDDTTDADSIAFKSNLSGFLTENDLYSDGDTTTLSLLCYKSTSAATYKQAYKLIVGVKYRVTLTVDTAVAYQMKLVNLPSTGNDPWYTVAKLPAGQTTATSYYTPNAVTATLQMTSGYNAIDGTPVAVSITPMYQGINQANANRAAIIELQNEDANINYRLSQNEYEDGVSYGYYSGNKIVPSNRIGWKKINTQATAQGASIYNGIGIMFGTGSGGTDNTFGSYNVKSRKTMRAAGDAPINGLPAASSTTSWHCNSCQFSDIFYDADDAFPLIYIGGNQDDRANQIAVGRIVPENTKYYYHIDIVQIITVSITGLSYFNLAYDDMTGNLVLHSGGKRIYMVSTPDIFDSNDQVISSASITDSEVVDSFVLTDDSLATPQGCCVHKGILYAGFGSQYRNYLRVIDLLGKVCINTLDINSIIPEVREIESISFMDEIPILFAVNAMYRLWIE